MSRMSSRHTESLATRYQNAGNESALALVPRCARRVLDVGCGAGDNARIMTTRGHKVWGITRSQEEAAMARRHCESVWIGDVEKMPLPVDVDMFDVVLMSHVLEHLVAPRETVARLAQLVRPKGLLVAAVPNMACWRVRWRILRGDWSRDDTGFFDRTHLQFWSFDTRFDVLAGTPFEIIEALGSDGSLPLRPFRRLAPRSAASLDRLGTRLLPNFASEQVVLLGRRIG
jgi:SAM-dependent methyltransferase